LLILKSNRLCTKEAGKALAEMLAANTVLTELDLSDNLGPGARDGPGFAQELAVGIRDNGALSVLSLNCNNLRAEGGRALAVGLKDNQGITSLNISSNLLGLDSNGSSDTSGVVALADAIPGMGAMSVFTFDGGYSDSRPVTMKTSMTEADFSGKALRQTGAIMLSAFLPKCT
jgi:hypothetical protein